MRVFCPAIILAVAVVGCMRGATDPVSTSTHAGNETLTAAIVDRDTADPHRLWGEWLFIFDASHENVQAVPQRGARFHFNSAKFLETYCTDCLQIVRMKNNGDGTIDLTVRLKHPFTGHPELTGFDVKGIIMFPGSLEYRWTGSKTWPYYNGRFRVSWRELGDPELLNPDGYSPRWSPSWDSGSSLPIFNYWPGKYSKGTPTANLNGYIDFYTDEQRHMFRSYGVEERTYHIWLPPGPLVAGYAVEACWEPPTVTPVTDPLNDFPISANQQEPYHFEHIVNNNEPIEERASGFSMGTGSGLHRRNRWRS